VIEGRDERGPAGADVTIEAMTAGNLSELVEMFRLVDGAHFPHATAEAAARFLEEPADIHVLGRAKGEVVAFGMLRGWHEGYDVPSLGIAVRRDREGRGYGRAMMAALERLARERGAGRIRLRVHQENVRARALYDACGYLEAGLERGETLMLLELDDPLVAPE
jgi:ribosomal protein S18 acetylase RimI-like enzyme